MTLHIKRIYVIIFTQNNKDNFCLETHYKISHLYEVYKIRLKEYRDVLTWSYKKIASLDVNLLIHLLALNNNTYPINKDQMCFRQNLVPLFKYEVNKLMKVFFICEVKYLTWI